MVFEGFFSVDETVKSIPILCSKVLNLLQKICSLQQKCNLKIKWGSTFFSKTIFKKTVS